MGDAYENLIKKLRRLPQQKGGRVYTPQQRGSLMIGVMDQRKGETVYDPACGPCGMLLALWRTCRSRRRTADTYSVGFTSQEKNLTTAAVARMKMSFTAWRLRGRARRHAWAPIFKNPRRVVSQRSISSWPSAILVNKGAATLENDPWDVTLMDAYGARSGDLAWVTHGQVLGTIGTGAWRACCAGACSAAAWKADIRRVIIREDLRRGGDRPCPEPLLRNRARVLRAFSCCRRARTASAPTRLIVVDASSRFRKGTRAEFSRARSTRPRS